MANPNTTLINALRAAAKQLREGAYYAWGHHGGCNCGNLLQVVTKLSKETIVAYAHTGTGEWSELAEEYCTLTGTPAHLMIRELEAIGLTTTDIHHIEYLSDKAVLQYLPGGFRWLKKNVREDVISYFEAMAQMLEDKLTSQIHINFDALFEPIQRDQEAFIAPPHLPTVNV